MKKIFVIALLVAGLVTALPSAHPDSIGIALKAYYRRQFLQFSHDINSLTEAVKSASSDTLLREKLRIARLTYKHLELFTEYYLPLDAPKLNGLPATFVDEEDPSASQEPLGLQVIGSLLFPQNTNTNRTVLLACCGKLQRVAAGLAANTAVFQPDEFMLDAVTEELYRITALGITGFDSPLAAYSLPECASTLSAADTVLAIYQSDMIAHGVEHPAGIRRQIHAAENYLRNHNDFDGFNRMEFITGYLQPLMQQLSAAKEKMGYTENKARFALIKKSGSLFDRNSLRIDCYYGDDSVTAAGVALGKKLFNEPLLSANGKRSCAGCHHSSYAFTDGLSRAMELDEHASLPRNTPTLWNAALQRNLFSDSRQHSLDHLVIEVLGNAKEMNGSSDRALDNLVEQPGYRALLATAFPGAVPGNSKREMVKSISMYLRTLISYNARFDQYVRGNYTMMSKKEVAGFNLFMGKARCGTCHYAPLFNGSKPPDYYYQESEVIGVPATADSLHPVQDTDPGRIAILPYPFLDHSFKTPTLRNIVLTAPYMHNGVFKTLEEVIEFYNRGGGRGIGLDVPNQTLPAEKLGLTRQEKSALRSFLLTLTDTSGAH